MININKITKLTNEKWINLFNIEYITKHGKTGNWIFASRKQNPQPGADIKPDAVVIIALLKDGRKRKLVVTKEYRIPLGDYEYGLPAGLFDENESPVQTAKRELMEETGLKLTKVLYVGIPCVSSAGLSDESVVYVVCECTGTPNSDGNEPTEDIEVKVVDLDGLRQISKSNKKISAKALPFFLMFDAINKIAWPKHMTQDES